MRDKKVGGDTVAPLWNVAKSYGAGGASVTRQSCDLARATNRAAWGYHIW